MAVGVGDSVCVSVGVVGVAGVGVGWTHGTWGWKELNVALQVVSRFVTVMLTAAPKLTSVPVAVPTGQSGGCAVPRKSGAMAVRLVGEAAVTTAFRVPNVTDASAIVAGRLKPVIVTTVSFGPDVGTTDVMTGRVSSTRYVKFEPDAVSPLLMFVTTTGPLTSLQLVRKGRLGRTTTSLSETERTAANTRPASPPAIGAWKP